ncbi:hypothetical protein P7C71_g4366, partial [Lecanoromycetidae sp. Uapishka_2]
MTPDPFNPNVFDSNILEQNMRFSFGAPTKDKTPLEGHVMALNSTTSALAGSDFSGQSMRFSFAVPTMDDSLLEGDMMALNPTDPTLVDLNFSGQSMRFSFAVPTMDDSFLEGYMMTPHPKNPALVDSNFPEQSVRFSFAVPAGDQTLLEGYDTSLDPSYVGALDLSFPNQNVRLSFALPADDHALLNQVSALEQVDPVANERTFSEQNAWMSFAFPTNDQNLVETQITTATGGASTADAEQQAIDLHINDDWGMDQQPGSITIRSTSPQEVDVIDDSHPVKIDEDGNTKKRKASFLAYDRFVNARNSEPVPKYSVKRSKKVHGQQRAIDWLRAASRVKFSEDYDSTLADWGVARTDKSAGTCIILPEDWRSLQPTTIMETFDNAKYPLAGTARLKYHLSDHVTTFHAALTTLELCWIQFWILREAKGLGPAETPTRPRWHPYSTFETQLPLSAGFTIMELDPTCLSTARSTISKPDLRCIFCSRVKSFAGVVALWSHLYHKHSDIACESRLEEIRRTASIWQVYWDTFSDGGKYCNTTVAKLKQIEEESFDWEVVKAWRLR